MIRYPFIYNQVLQIYRQMDQIVFPIEPDRLIKRLPNCKILTYEQFAKMNGCSIEDVIAICESKSGCTHYDVVNNNYLILWNSEQSGNNVEGRRRWTKAHEFGHVVLKHFQLVSELTMAEHSFSNAVTPAFEAEADRFAATLLCPMPLFQLLDISSPADIRKVFGLSVEASANRWNEYLKWKNYHRKTAWENDMRRIFLQKR